MIMPDDVLSKRLLLEYTVKRIKGTMTVFYF